MKMLYLRLCLLLILSIVTNAENIETVGVEVQIESHTMLGKMHSKKTLLVKRNIPEVCKKVHINNKTLWEGDYAHSSVPKSCKSTFVHTKGKILAISLDPDVETYGELEVLVTIKEIKRKEKVLLVDARSNKWFEYLTIPLAINVPFKYIQKSDIYAYKFEDAMQTFGVKIKNNEYDFSEAKTLVIFCNALWCTQSPDMIYALLKLGYPAEKLKWYRGGLQSWLSVGMTTTRDIK